MISVISSPLFAIRPMLTEPWTQQSVIASLLSPGDPSSPFSPSYSMNTDSLPTLCSELAYLQTLQGLLQKRLSLLFPHEWRASDSLSRLGIERK